MTISEEKAKKNIGKIYNYLEIIAVNPEREKNGNIIYDCKCLRCGKTTKSRLYQLVTGTKKSCGCFRSDKAREVITKRHETKQALRIGKRYGRLTITKENKKIGGKDTIYECICDCGNIHLVRYKNLMSGQTRSCGCYRSEIRKKAMEKYWDNWRENHISQS